MLAFLLREIERVAEHFHPSRRALLLVHRLMRGMHLLGERVEPPPIRERDAHQLGDNIGRQHAGDIRHQVAFAALDNIVDDFFRQLLDAWPKRGRHCAE